MRGSALAREFRDFLLKTNMFALAMAVVIGNAVGKVVNAVVADFVMPFIGILTPEGNWRDLKLSIARLNFGVGSLLGALLDFIIIAAVVFLITKAFVRQQAPPPAKTCGQCLESVNINAKRCKFCTSPLS